MTRAGVIAFRARHEGGIAMNSIVIARRRRAAQAKRDPDEAIQSYASKLDCFAWRLATTIRAEATPSQTPC